jgi:hypothetical protein
VLELKPTLGNSLLAAGSRLLLKNSKSYAPCIEVAPLLMQCGFSARRKGAQASGKDIFMDKRSAFGYYYGLALTVLPAALIFTGVRTSPPSGSTIEPVPSALWFELLGDR